MTATAQTPLTIAGRQLSSRLILGTGGFTNHEVLAAALEARGEEVDRLRREREDSAARLKVCEGELSALRLVAERERADAIAGGR